MTYPDPDSALRLRIVTFGPDTTGLYKYILRFRCPQRAVPEGEAVPPEFLEEGTSKGYVFPDGPIGELVALFSLRLQARFFLLSTTFTQLVGERGLDAVERAMRNAIEKNEPADGLDRLHTFATRFVRALCTERGIATPRDKPLHGLFGQAISNRR